ncbi:MAG: hypothetical protein CL878_07645 [Dehalococcoidia bacterium]|nr:hypothetical protein [Dehalococcoidia bacterium]
MDETAIVAALRSRLQSTEERRQQLAAQLDEVEQDRQSLERVLAMYDRPEELSSAPNEASPQEAVQAAEPMAEASSDEVTSEAVTAPVQPSEPVPPTTTPQSEPSGQEAEGGQPEDTSRAPVEEAPAMSMTAAADKQPGTRKAEDMLDGRSYRQFLEEYEEREPGRLIKLSPMLHELFGDTITRQEFRLLWNGLNNTLGRIVRRGAGWERVADRTGTYRRVR